MDALHPAALHPAKGDLDAATALREEQAAALGRCGRRLEALIEAYRRHDDQRLLDDLTRCLWALVVQRECAGARTGNLDSIVREYGVPPEAVARL